MALSYSFILNGQTLDATIGAVVYEKLEEALDESAFNLPITTLGYPHKIFGLLEITAKDSTVEKNFAYIIISDEVSISSKDGFYEHSLMAIEYTHKLDKSFVSALTFTKPFLKRSRAPFKFLGSIETSGLIGNTVYTASELFPKVSFQENYFVNGKIKVEQTTQALILRDTLNHIKRDVYIRTNINSTKNMELYNVSFENVEFTLRNDSGDYEIEVGYIDTWSSVESEFIPVFRHYTRLIDDRRYTLYDMLSRVRASIPIERESVFEKTRLFNIDTQLVDYFKSIDMPQMFFSQQTARQVLNTMFKYINAISRLQHDYDNGDSLGVDFFNKRSSEFTNDDNVSFDIMQNAENYGSRAVAFLNQTLQSNFRDNPSIKTPADNYFKTVRSSNVQLTDGSFELKLERPIYEVSKLTIKLPKLRVELRTNGSSQPKVIPQEYVLTKENYEIDVTSRFLEKRVWDLKQNTVDFLTYDNLPVFSEDVGMRLNKNANIFWEKNSKKINLSLPVGSDNFKENLLEEMLRDAIHEEITLGVYDEDFFGNYQVPLETFPSGSAITSLQSYEVNFALVQGTDINTDNIFRNIAFNIEYVTLDETVIRQERMDNNDVLYESEIRMNETTAVSDFGRVSRNLFGKLERSGLPKKTITKIHENLSTVLDVGQIDSQDYIVVERKLIFHNEFIEGVYTLSKNHNRLNEFNGINQEFRIFEIPNYSQVIKRLDFYSDNIYIVSPDQRARNPIDETDTTIFNFQDKFKIPFAHIVGDDFGTINKKISYAFVRTDGFLKQYPDSENNYRAVMTPIVSFGGKNNLNFNFKFDSNIVAGDSLVLGETPGFLNIGTIKNFYNSPISYTDELGFFDKLWFGMGAQYKPTGLFDNITTKNEPYFNDGYAYPLVRGNEEELQQDFFVKNQDFNNPDWFVVFKDSATNYGFSYQLNILPLESNEFVLGQNFFLQNPLVMNYTEQIPKKLFIYEDGTEYNKFEDLIIKQGYEIEISIDNSVLIPNDVDYTFNFSQTVLDQMGNATSWAIGDEEGNLFMACNKNYSGFGMIARHKVQNLYQIGDKIFSQSVSISEPIQSRLLFEAVVATMKLTTISEGIVTEVDFNATISLAYERDFGISIDSNITGNFVASINYSKSMFELLDSNIEEQGIVQILFDKEVEENLQSNIDLIAKAQINFEKQRDIIINSNISFDAIRQVFNNNFIDNNIQSNIFVSAVRQIPLSGLASDEIISEMISAGFAQNNISSAIFNNDIFSEGIALGKVTDLFKTQDVFDILKSSINFNGYRSIPISGIVDSNINSDIDFVGDRAYIVTAKTLGTESSTASVNFDFTDQSPFNVTLNSSTFTTVREGANGIQFSATAPTTILSGVNVYTFNRWDELNTAVGTTLNPIDLTVTEDLSLVVTYTKQVKIWNLLGSSSNPNAYSQDSVGTYFADDFFCDTSNEIRDWIRNNTSTASFSVGHVRRLTSYNDQGDLCGYDWFIVQLV